MAVESDGGGEFGDHWDGNPVVGPNVEVGVVAPLNDRDGPVGLRHPCALREEAGWVVGLMQDKGGEDEVDLVVRHRYAALGGLDDIDIVDPRRVKASAQVVQHFRLDICRDDVPRRPDDLVRRDGEEPRPAPQINDRHAGTHPGIPKRRFWRERLGTFVGKKAFRVLRTESVRPMCGAIRMVAVVVVSVMTVAVVGVGVAFMAVTRVGSDLA